MGVLSNPPHTDSMDIRREGRYRRERITLFALLLLKQVCIATLYLWLLTLMIRPVKYIC